MSAAIEPYSRAQIEESVKRLLISELGVSPAALEGSTADTPLLGRGVGLDSVEALGLALAGVRPGSRRPA